MKNLRKLTFLVFTFCVIFSVSAMVSPVLPQTEERLAQGNPPLTKSMVFQSIDLLEWSLDISFPSEQKSKIQQILINAWQTNNRAQIKSVLDAVNIHNKLSQMTPAERNNFRERFKTVILENLRKDPTDELSQTVLSVIQPTNNPRPIPDVPISNKQTVADDKIRGEADKQTQTNASPRQQSEGEEWTFSQSAPLTAEQAESVLEQFTPKKTVANSGVLTFEQALASARRFLNDGVGSKAVADFYTSPKAKDADSAAAIAAGAMIRGLPTLAVAALLRAHELEPQDATHLVNLAAVLSYIGMSHEALAILDSPIVKNGENASPLEIGGKAGALNVRGFALLEQGQAKEAEDALRQAVALSPNFGEAKTNLAFALWAQDNPKKKEEGAQLIAAVWRRSTPSKMYDVVEKTPPTTESEGEIPIEVFDGDKTGAANLDLSRGKRLRLPDLKIPGSLEASVAMHPKYEKLGKEITAIVSALGSKQEQLLEARESKTQKEIEKAADNPSAMSAILARQEKYEKFDELINWDNVRQQPSVRPFWEKLREACRNNYQGVHFDQGCVQAGIFDDTKLDKIETQANQLAKKFAQIEGRNGYPSPLGKDEDRPKRCDATREAHAKWRSAIHNYDTAFRNYLQAAYKYMTALIANISDPVEHELAQNRIEQQIYFAWQTEGINYVDSFYNAANEAMKYYCKSSNEPESEDLQNLTAEKPDRCPEELKGKNKMTIDLAIVSVSFNCESIGVEVSAPSWITPFIEWEGKFKGGWISQYKGSTISFGVKVGTKIPGVGALGIKPGLSQKAGGYVKVDSGGNVKDYGLKSGTSVKVSGGTKVLDQSVGSGAKTGSSLTFSFAPTMGNH